MKNLNIPLFDLVMSITNTVDLISPTLVDHHKRVAYLSYCFAEELGLSREERNDIFLAAALHDIGGLTLKERIDALEFELKDSDHSINGFLLLSKHQPFAKAAEIIRHHHCWWEKSRENQEIPLGSYIVHLADRIAVLINPQKDILNQMDRIYQTISQQKGKMFMPDLVHLFQDLLPKVYIWLEAASHYTVPILKDKVNLGDFTISIDELLSVTKVFSHLIDFRSAFTARHSSGVASAAESLAQLSSFSIVEQKMMRVAGFLHDIGKLAVPGEILEKPGQLTKDEFNIIKTHTFYTYRTLFPIKELNVINNWASLHHEKLDGSGYPFNLNEDSLSLGSRIMAVADVFTALTEDRPYRKGMPKSQVINILKKMVDNMALDKNVVDLLLINYEEINRRTLLAQEVAVSEYKLFLQKCYSMKSDSNLENANFLPCKLIEKGL
ncbi:MAG: HD domain-containing phosphohydrolase [Bacillota bacterium]